MQREPRHGRRQQQSEEPPRRSCGAGPSGKVKVSCFKGSLDLGTNMAMGLADISESGVMLLLKAELDKSQDVTLCPRRPRTHASGQGPGQDSLVRADGKGRLPVRDVQLDSYLRYQDIMKIA